MGNYITEVGNNAFVLSSAFLAWICWERYKHYGKTWAYILFIVALWVLVISVGVRIGWWSLGLKYAPDGSTYHPFFLEWKWIPTIVTGAGYTAAVAMLVGFIDELDKSKIIAIAGTIVAAAFVIGVL